MYSKFESLFSKAANGEVFDDMFDEVVQLYGSDFDGQTLKSQLGILQSHFIRSEESVRLFHVVEYLISLDESC